MAQKVLIFNKVILPRSHTFVAAQSLNIPSFEPIFIGTKIDRDGLHLLNGYDTCLLNESTAYPTLSRLLFESNIMVPRLWKKSLEEKNAKLIHAHFGKGGYYCAPLSKMLDIPLITSFHGSDITQNSKRSYSDKHKSLTFSESNKIIAISRFIERKLLEKGCPEEKIIQHYTGVDNTFFQPENKKSPNPSVLFVGRLIEQKGCHFLIRAMTEIQKKIPDVDLFIAGYGKNQEELESLASGMKNVFFLGPQSRVQVKALMDSAWITCLPSITMKKGNEEGLSMVCLESQSMGTPVVGFNTGGVGEAVEHEKTGLLVSEKNTAALSNAISEVLLNNTLRRQLAENGMKRVDCIFNLTTQSKRLASIYSSLT